MMNRAVPRAAEQQRGAREAERRVVCERKMDDSLGGDGGDREAMHGGHAKRNRVMGDAHSEQREKAQTIDDAKQHQRRHWGRHRNSGGPGTAPHDSRISIMALFSSPTLSS